MISSGTTYRKRHSWIAGLLFAAVLLLLGAGEARAEDRCVADLGGLIDGFVTPNPPAQVQIDGNCTIRNFPASNPLRTNFSFYTSPGTNNERWLVIFDNVVHTGNMSCNNVQGHHIWFTNGSSSKIKENCQNLLIPVEKIVKLNPPGPPVASIGVPFTYTLRIPVLFDPATGTVINSNGSVNDLHHLTVWDDLNLSATGVDLSFVSQTVTWLDGITPVPGVTFSNAGGVLTFDNFPIITAGTQFLIKITVVLNNSSTNTPGKQFINTAKWQFGRLIDGVYYEPLPGEWGISPPLTIAAPVLTLTKTGPATMNVGQWGNFTIDVRNTGLSDAWDVTLRDQLPRISTGGMCDLTPEILSAQVFAADGVTPVSGKGPLSSGTDYSLTYSAAPTCRFDFTAHASAARIGPNERLIVRYRTQLDSNTQNGATLTNFAGAIQWFNGDSTNSTRQTFTRTLTNGTPGIVDHEDDHTVTVALTGNPFSKTVANITSGANPATIAAPGDKLRYTLRFRTTGQALSNFRIFDELDALNSPAAFAPGTLTNVTAPAGADVTATSGTGGAKGTGVIDVRNLNLPVNAEAVITFDITLKSTLTNGTVVLNQSTARLTNGTVVAISDDPNVNGTSDPTVIGDEDPTRITIVSAPAFRVQKISTDITGDPNVLYAGETLRYTITAKDIGNGAGVNVMLRDAIPANTTYVAGSTTLNGAAVADVAGTSPLVNGMRINSPADPTPGSMPADASSSTANVATITFNVVVNANVAGGTIISNQGFVSATGITDQPSDDPDTSATNDPTRDTVANSPDPVLVVTKSGPTTAMNLAQWGSFAIDVRNTGLSDAWNVSLRDLLPRITTGGMCDLTPEILSAQVFAADGVTPISGKGPLNSGTDYSLSYSAAPNCRLDITILTASGKIGPNERLIVRYRTQLDANTQNGVTLTNIAGVTQWFNGDSSNTNRTSYNHTLSNGTPGVLDHEDAFNVTVTVASTPSFRVQKISTDLTADPNVLLPGETLRYTITVKNIGTGDATNAMLRDAIPANTTYVANSTKLNGTAVADVAGQSRLVSGMQINSPANATPGSMPADASSSTANVATITFDVVVNANVPDGTVISNQGFVNATGVADQPSDDPDTPTANDPTRDTVSNTAPPVLVVTKSGPTTAMNPGQWGNFTIDVRNTGLSDAWDVSLRDLLPRISTGGMCDLTPEILSAQVFAADGVSPVSGKGPLNSGTDYSLSYSAAPNCRLDMTILTAAGKIGPNERLIVRYRTQLDANTQNGVTLTNIAGATQWFNGDSSNTNRTSYPHTLTNGTPGVPDHEDAYSVTVAPSAPPTFRIQKVSSDLTGDPSVLLPGETVRYTITVKNIGTTDGANVMLRDAVPANTIYVASSTTMNGATVADGAGGSPLVTGMLIHSPANATPGTMPADASSNTANVATITFDVVVNANAAGGTVISNQGFVSGTGFQDLPSDDPRTSAPADPTRDIVGNSGYFFEKTVADLTSGANPATTAAPGDKLRYTLRLRTTNQALSNFRILDELDALNAQAAFASGTLSVGTFPAGADLGSTNPTGGSKGTGVLDVRNLNIPANGEVVIQFDVNLKAAINNGTVVANQSTVFNNGPVFATSDDPNVNGAANPAVAGDEDPTRLTILSAPAFRVQKISNDLTGDSNVLLAGETLRYTITVKNIGTTDATNVTLRDAVPANTTYVAGSTRLNGFAAADVAGQSPLANGMRINPPANTTSGFMPVDSSNSQPISCWMVDGVPYCRANPPDPSSYVATITFDVVVNANTANGTVISNQGVVSGTGFPDQPSDDPRTPTLDDPTRDIVGNMGYFFEKTAANLTSGANPATAAAPGDKLRYTLRFRTINQALSNFRILDELDALNAQPAFVPGTLTLVTTPAGADISATSSTGGAKGTGVIDIRNLNMPATGEILIQFDVTLKPAIANGTVVSNQSTLLANGTTFATSDDPNVNGAASPTVSGDEDPTRVTIASSANFRVQKISRDLTGDPNVLLAGETLRYTITVKNIGTTDAVNALLRDAVPANTTYVAGSTALNGTAVADVAGQSPLVGGMPINPPGGTTPGSMPADASSSTNNIATITFDVVVNANVADRTIISNQSFFSATGVPDLPSDDPGTPALNDPTQNIVTNRPTLYADKRVGLFTDLGSPNIVDPGDVLRYTITITNSAAIPAAGAVLTDAVPANTTYVANTTLLNGAPVSQPDNGVSPLASGISIGTIAPGATAVVQYDLRINNGTPTGTVISNQATVTSSGLPNLLTDGDGNPATGPEPTTIMVGAGQNISITNQVSVVGGGAAVPGAQVEYVVKVVNTESVPAYNIVITDDLNAPQAGQITYVNSSATMNGSPAGVSFTGSTITADYASVSGGPLAPGATIEVRFRAILATTLAAGTTVTNTSVATWNTPPQTVSASASITLAGPGNPGTPGPATLGGSAWYDANFDNVQDSRERALSGWTVELYKDNQLSQSTTTDDTGAWRIIGVEANEGTAIRYELRFSAPGAGANTALLGRGASPFTNGMQRISDIVAAGSANVQGLNLPIHPNGVIYNTLERTAIAGATLNLLDGSRSPLPASCFDDAAQQGQITLAGGYYRFDINFSNPSCPSSGDYLISVTPPPGPTYVAGVSQIIPPTSGSDTAAFSVPSCPGSIGDAIPSTPAYCEVQPSEFAPNTTVAARSAGTTYHVHLMLDASQQPGTSQIFNNHIPIDPLISGSLSISVSTPLLNVSRGQLVPYTITVNNSGGTIYTGVSIVDYMPAGFSYVTGSALLDSVPTEPVMDGRTLSWDGLVIAGKQERKVRLLLNVGAGVSAGGDFVNRAQLLISTTTNTLSRKPTANALSRKWNAVALTAEATATVRITPDPTLDCTDVIGKVFNDANRNGLQDEGEEGLRGVRVVTVTGLQAVTDPYGRYHITCALTPHESRGSNFVLKLDDRTLPSGFRLTTDQVQIKRATSGKEVKINFGASIHRVVGIDLSDEAFKPGTTEIREQWRPRLNLLLQELRKGPAVLRLSYVADTEDAALVEKRVAAIKKELAKSWDAVDRIHGLTIEPEVFWRLGAPPKRPGVPKN